MINPIKTIKAIYYANRPLYAKMPNSMVKLPLSLETGIYNKISSERANLEYIANMTHKPIEFAAKDENSTLMNYGTYTTVLRNDDLQEKIAEQMYAHINNVVNHV